MTQTVVATLSLAESGTTEEAVNEAIADAQFAPYAAVDATAVVAYVNATEYAKGALVKVGAKAYAAGTEYALKELAAEGGIVYEAIKDKTKGEAPSTHPEAWRPTALAGQVFRSLEAKNKEHPPLEDTDFAHWAPASGETTLTTNPALIPLSEPQKLKTRYQIVGVSIDPGQQVYPYEAGKKYRSGEYSVEGGTGYEALKATEGEAPSEHPEAWKAIGPAISLGV